MRRGSGGTHLWDPARPADPTPRGRAATPSPLASGASAPLLVTLRPALTAGCGRPCGHAPWDSTAGNGGGAPAAVPPALPGERGCLRPPMLPGTTRAWWRPCLHPAALAHPSEAATAARALRQVMLQGSLSAGPCAAEPNRHTSLDPGSDIGWVSLWPPRTGQVHWVPWPRVPRLPHISFSPAKSLTHHGQKTQICHQVPQVGSESVSTLPSGLCITRHSSSCVFVRHPSPPGYWHPP